MTTSHTPSHAPIAAAPGSGKLNPSGWHAGEQTLQARAGLGDRLAEIGPLVMRDAMPAQHRDFFAQLPWLVAGAVDAQGQPWATALAGAPGFLHSPDPRHLRVDALPDVSDPLAALLRTGAPVGLLGIQPWTRRRNRMNGIVDDIDAHGFDVEVRQSFGNCPKYIQPRSLLASSGWEKPAPPVPAVVTDRLDAASRRMVTAADTFFIATAHPSALHDNDPANGVDVSHRGGLPGFVQVDDDGGVLTVPDYSGNYFFNTLGNIALNPRAGLVFVDFDNGDMLHLAVTAEIVWSGPEVLRFEGAERLLRLRVTQAVRRAAAFPLRWASSGFGMPSFNPMPAPAA